MAFGIARQEAAGSRQGTVMAEGSKDVAQFAFFRSGIADPVSSDQGQFQHARDFDCGTVARFFIAMQMALKFDVDIVVFENLCKTPNLANSFIESTLSEGCGERAVITAGETDETGGVLFQFLFANCAFLLLSAKLHFGNEAAEVLIAGAGGDEKGKTRAIADCRFQIGD